MTDDREQYYVEDKPKREKAQTQQVSVVRIKDQSALVEWSDGKRLRRAYVPTFELEGEKCKKSVLDAGIPYGIEWEKYLDTVTLTPANIADALRAAGFWTVDDVECKVRQAQAAIANMVGVNAASLARLARNDK